MHIEQHDARVRAEESQVSRFLEAGSHLTRGSSRMFLVVVDQTPTRGLLGCPLRQASASCLS